MSGRIVAGLLTLVLFGSTNLPSLATDAARGTEPGRGVVVVRQGAQADGPTFATAEQLAQLREVLARPEFGAAAGRSVVDRALDPVRSLLRWVLGEAIRLVARLLQGGEEAVRYSVLALGLVVTVVAGIVVRRLLRGSLVTEAALAGAAPSRPISADDELAQARALAEVGDARAAVHHHYLAIVRRLDERGLLRFDRALTNRELLPRVPADAAVRASLAPLVARFDRLWYGQSTCSPEEYEEFARLADRVWASA